jgi:hypothetical protein
MNLISSFRLFQLFTTFSYLGSRSLHALSQFLLYVLLLSQAEKPWPLRTQAEVIQTYEVQDKEKSCIGRMRGLNLAAVSPTTNHLTAFSEWFRHNLLHKPALSELTPGYFV